MVVPVPRLAAQLAASVSRMTLLRQVRALPDPQLMTPRVLGVDDFALRRGHHYGTILIDIESHRPIEVLPDRSAGALAGWLRAHPGVEIICRDRAGAYAEGAAAGTPEAIQIADRWHIWNNLGDAVERTGTRHRTALTAAIGGPETTEGPDSADTAEGPAAMQLGPVAPAQRLDRTAIRNRQRFTEVQQLLSEGVSLRGIGQRLGLARGTVRRFARAESAEELLVNNRTGYRVGVLADYKPYLHQRWNDGATNAAVLFQEITARGYRGSEKTVRNYLRAFRGRTRAVEPQRKPPAVRRVTGWIMTNPANLDLDDQHDLDAILAASPELAELTAHIRVRRDHGPTPRSRPPPVDGKR
ncbi:transposase [Nocardia zapadnayensis]|nr:transposase [Nocardia zapadnayensis]MCX0270028.1 transposase [Nocardia zapadnayensis]